MLCVSFKQISSKIRLKDLVSLETLCPPVEFKIKLSVLDQGLAAQHDFVMSGPLLDTNREMTLV